MRAYSIDLRERIVAAVDTGQPAAEVARLFRVSVATVNRYRRRRERDALLPGQSPGRPRALTPADEQVLDAQVAARPDATLADHCRRLEADSGVRLSVATLGRALQRLGWTRKKSRWQRASVTRTPANSGARMCAIST